MLPLAIAAGLFVLYLAVLLATLEWQESRPGIAYPFIGAIEGALAFAWVLVLGRKATFEPIILVLVMIIGIVGEGLTRGRWFKRRPDDAAQT